METIILDLRPDYPRTFQKWFGVIVVLTSFPNSVWECKELKLCFRTRVEAKLSVVTLPSRAWEREKVKVGTICYSEINNFQPNTL